MKLCEIVLFLASRSPRRQKLIRSLPLPVRLVDSRYDELTAKRLPDMPRALALHHALNKALGAILPPASANAHAIVLGADTIVAYRGKVLGKPKSRQEAMAMLRLLAGRTHRVITGLALVHPATGRSITGTEQTNVTFKKMDNSAIRRYIAAVNPLDKAGGYAIQEGPKIVKSIVGSRSNVIGLPMELLKKQLRKAMRWFR